EIKFRAFDKASGLMFGIDGFDKKYVWGYKAGVQIKVEISEVILMQYTGLSDKNGKEICEGDICIGKRGGSSYAFEVKWDEIDTRFLGYTSSGYICYVGQEPSVEVIGNIYENQELIKE
ncbi:YopX family protein, partial [Anaerosacchariphilus polymeriproducens]